MYKFLTKSHEISWIFKVVIPSNSNLKTSQGCASIKKEYLASTIRPENTFSTLCNSILSEIYDSCQTRSSVDVIIIIIKLFIRIILIILLIIFIKAIWYESYHMNFISNFHIRKFLGLCKKIRWTWSHQISQFKNQTSTNNKHNPSSRNFCLCKFTVDSPDLPDSGPPWLDNLGQIVISY